MYDVVFDVREAGYANWPFGAAGLLFVVIGAAMVLWRRRHPYEGRSDPHRALPYIFFGFSVFWTTAAFGGTYFEYRNLADAMETGRYETVEGVVKDFEPMPYSGHKHESFKVAGRRFEYSDFIVTAGFNRTRSHGGPIHEGLRVRIAAVGGVIARLEIERPGR